MKRAFVILIVLSVALSAAAQTPTGEEILKKIDENMVVDQAVSTATMIISSRTGTRSVQSKNWVSGQDTAFVEYLAPAREKGKKMLRLGDKLWTYTPEPHDRIITISGHLLRQSLMGSDLSYEDMMDNSRLVEVYDAEVSGRGEIGGRDCRVLQLTAKEEGVAYHSRKIWVDAERLIPLKEERFARSGRLLKTIEIQEVFQQDGRWLPKRMRFKDELARGEGTFYVIDAIDFDVEIPDHRFTKASLRE